MLLTPTLVYVDTVDLAMYAFALERWEGDLTPAVDAPPTRPAGDGFGERVSGAPGRLAPRTITLIGVVYATAATLRTAIEALVARCAGSASGPTSNAVALALVPVGDTTARRWTAYLTRTATVERLGAVGDAAEARVTLTFVCPDPTAEDATATTAALSTTIARTALGTVRCRPVVTLDGGSWTAITVTYKDGADVTVSTCTITKPSGIAGVGQAVEIDCAAESVVQVNGSTRTPRNDWFGSSGDFPELDPAHVIAAVNPGLVLSSGTGGVSYRKRWR